MERRAGYGDGLPAHTVPRRRHTDLSYRYTKLFFLSSSASSSSACSCHRQFPKTFSEAINDFFAGMLLSLEFGPGIAIACSFLDLPTSLLLPDCPPPPSNFCRCCGRRAHGDFPRLHQKLVRRVYLRALHRPHLQRHRWHTRSVAENMEKEGERTRYSAAVTSPTCVKRHDAACVCPRIAVRPRRERGRTLSLSLSRVLSLSVSLFLCFSVSLLSSSLPLFP